MKIGYVYKIISPTNRIYIGSSSNVEKRFSNYRCYACKNQRKLYNSLKKYGWEQHTFKIIWKGPINEMLEKEVLFGLEVNVLSQDNLNCKLPKSGEMFACVSEETRSKMRVSSKKRFQTMSDEKRQLLGKKRIGQKLSEKAIEQRSKSVRKPVIQLNLNNNFLQQWSCAAEAGKILSISSSDITQCCKNKKKSSGGFKWKYLNEQFEKEKEKERPRKPRNNEFNKNVKTIIQMDLKSNVIKEWQSASKAARELNLMSSHIISCCRNNRNKHGNFKWKYKNENILITK